MGVVIERMKDLPETMSLLYLFAPIYSNNSQVRHSSVTDCRDDCNGLTRACLASCVLCVGWAHLLQQLTGL